MSFNFEKDNSLMEELKAIPFHEMKKEFEKRGIEDVWRPKTKKAIMVQEAFERLTSIKEEVEKEEKVQQEKIEETKKEKKEMSELELLREDMIRRHTIDGKLDKEAIQKSIDGNLRSLKKDQFNAFKKRVRTQRINVLESLLKE